MDFKGLVKDCFRPKEGQKSTRKVSRTTYSSINRLPTRCLKRRSAQVVSARSASLLVE